MKYTKRLLSALLAIVLVAANIVPLPASAEESTEGYYTYEVIDGEATITDCDSAISGDITIPSTLGGYPVTAIGEDAFTDCEQLERISIPYGVTSLEHHAFSDCTRLTGITIPDSVTNIGVGVFSWCTSLKSITIPNGVPEIRSFTFHGCDSLKSITIPNSVTSIGYYAFAFCDSLKSITIPDGVKIIDAEAFRACDGLESVTISDSVQIIGQMAFAYCTNLNSINIPNNLSTITTYAFYQCRSLKSITIPDSVTSIGYYAFSECNSVTSVSIGNGVTTISDGAFDGCRSLESINIPDGVTTIGTSAFNGCKRLERINIPESVTTIGASAFFGCDSLTGIYVEPGNPNYSSDDKGVLFDKKKTELIKAPCSVSGTYTIPNSVTTIGDSAFYYCNLTSITIPNSVTTIGDSAFCYCNLTSITIPDSVTYIGKRAFAYNDFECIVLNSITTIPDSAFTNCTSLESITIPKATTIGNYAFYWCTSLESITIPNSVTAIGDEAFRDCDSLKSITIPDSVTYIGEWAFSGCTSLAAFCVEEGNSNYSSDGKGVLFNKEKSELIQAPGGASGTYTISDSVTTISNYAFDDCTKLTAICVDKGNSNYSSDGRVLFNKEKSDLLRAPCGLSGTYTIPDGVITIDNGAFYRCENLKNIILPDGVTTIANYAFYWCVELKTISIPNSVTTIGDEAFYLCKRLTDVYYNGTKQQWENISIGYDNNNLKDAKIHFKGEATKLATPKASVSGNTLTWTGVAFADSYEIYRATSKSGKYTKVTTVAETSWADNVTPGKTYYYKVKAIYTADSSKNSDYSNYVSIDYKLASPVISVENNDSGKPYITWEKVSGAKKYTVYVATSQNGSYKKLGTSTKTYYTDTKAKAGTTYFYKVVANASSSKYSSGYSNTVSCGVICGTPAVTVTVDANTGKPSLSWKKVDGAAKYAIYRKLPTDTEFVLLAQQTAVSYKDTTAPIDTKCEYYVQALGKTEALNGAPSKVVTAASGIAKPTVTGDLNDLGQPKLSWNAVEGAVKYELYRSTKSGSGYVLIQTVEGLTCEDTTATIGKTYYYKLKAIGAVSKSADSSYVKLAGKCATPVISVENNDSGKPYITWEKVSGAKKYTVYVATSQNGTYKKLGTSTKTYYTDTKAKAGTTYFYKVIANASSSKYNSGYSNIASCGVICGMPAVTVTVDANTGKPALSWKQVDGAAKYAIYRKLPTDTEFVLQATQTAVSYKDTTAPVDTKCEYYVQALGKTEVLNGAPSKVVTATSGIAKPTVTGGLNDLGQPKLSWKKVDGAVKYEVYRSTKSGSGYVLIQTVEGRIYEDTTATIGKTYYYKLKAIGTVSKSADSDYVKLVGKCATPVISVENNASGKPMISWAQVSGAKKYTVYRATAEDGKYTKLGTTTKLTYTDTTAKAGNTYFYKVVANASSSKYDSGYSNIVSATYRLISSSTDKDTGSNAIWEDPTNTRDYYEETDPNRAGYLAYIATYNNTLFFYLQEDSMRMYLGKTYGMPLIASQETMLACTWFSSDSSVATVNNLGFVTPLKLGTTVISVCYTDPETGEQSVRRCDVRIESKPVYTIAQLEAAAKEEAQKIANYAMYEAGCTTDLERIAVAAALINAYVANGKGGTYYAIVDGQLVGKKIPGYNQPYGTLVTFRSTCAGDVRALGMVLEYMGFQWYHVNADKNTHQWCVVYDVDGQTAFADGAQYGVVGYGDRAEDQSNWMIYRNGVLQPFK